MTTDFDPTSLTDEQLRLALAEHARRQTAARPRADAICQQCGAVMPNVTAPRKYCSGTCRQKAFYWQQRAADNPAVAHRIRLQRKGWMPT